VKLEREVPTYRSSCVMDYEDLAGLSRLRASQTISMAGDAACIDNAPDTSSMPMSRIFRYRISQEKGLRGGLYSRHTGSHCIDDPPDIGPYIQQYNIRFYHMICKCTNNIREVIG
jgi:hypothetical protein